MAKAKVYFTNMRTSANINLLQKLEKLMDKAGIGQINFDHKFTAIKLHFGEPGNLAFLRPNYAKVVADKVRALGGKPFLTDCNTLYVGRRKNALEHMDAAYENGFSPLTTGCQVIIADGLKGTDEAYVPVPNGEYVKEAKIGRAIMMPISSSASVISRATKWPASAARSRISAWAAAHVPEKWSSTARASRM